MGNSADSFRGNYSSAETNQGRKLLIIWRFWPRKLFKGGNYSRAESIRGNTVSLEILHSFLIISLYFLKILSIISQKLSIISQKTLYNISKSSHDHLERNFTFTLVLKEKLSLQVAVLILDLGMKCYPAGPWYVPQSHCQSFL